ncbi:hypothetical protein [Amycolatopsis sp. DG1A-15b]|uniref:hypothetical protein n=1 Tax=Amycolatopsis sp. DG1A-15b TaxID=3052846 RepID=UPI00255B9AD6|nr:hypothetical protein [Amycolatopsis sp. DG1A-15b]WIX92034.1 hypothetical protein QRY02_16945 [Amycolatopsis sp. DG1A-15b]
MSRAGAPVSNRGSNYVFRGCGAIPEWVAEGAEDFREVLVVPVPPETIVFGTVTDPGCLPGIMRRLEVLGMHVESVHRVRELARHPCEAIRHDPDAAVT